MTAPGRDRVSNLHRGATELVRAESVADLHRRVVDIAADILGFDYTVVLVADGDRFEVADRTPQNDDLPQTHPIDHGLMGEAFRTGESRLVEDASTDPRTADATVPFRSGVIVPVGDSAVFEGLSDEPNAIDEDDRQLAELLCSYAGATLARIEAEGELRGQHDRFEALFENVPDAALFYEMVEGEPVVRRVNGAFERSFGWTADEVAGESIDDYIVPTGGWEEASSLNESLQRGESVRAEVERRTADGVRTFRLQVIPLALDAENDGGFAIYTDVTDQKRREEALQAQNERLDEFAAVVSHDLRNPINVAEGYLTLARESGDPAHFDRVEDALDRMDDLVADLLALARDGRDLGELALVPLEEVVDRAWEGVDTDAATLSIGADLDVEADPDRLCRLLENLFRNAVEHGGETVRVDVGPLTVRCGDREPIGFYVEDDGPGLPADIEVFENGVTTSADGTGFGLAIVRQIADAHGWSVRASESERGGARFEFQFESGTESRSGSGSGSRSQSAE